MVPEKPGHAFRRLVRHHRHAGQNMDSGGKQRHTGRKNLPPPRNDRRSPRLTRHPRRPLSRSRRNRHRHADGRRRPAHPLLQRPHHPVRRHMATPDDSPHDERRHSAYLQHTADLQTDRRHLAGNKPYGRLRHLHRTDDHLHLRRPAPQPRRLPRRRLPPI